MLIYFKFKIYCITQLTTSKGARMHTHLLPEGWPRPKGYANGVLAEGGKTIFIGGQMGVYSLVGRHAPDPVEATTNNFLFALPLTMLVNLVFLKDAQVTTEGAILAVASGAIASGLGYVAWYAALKGLTASRAAVIQLSVPAIAAFGAVVLLSEELTGRLWVSSAATIGGIALVLGQRNRGDAS